MNTVMERPILFRGPMVRSILEGRKTQTRRIVRFELSGRVKATGGPKNWHIDDPNVVKACPYGKPGDRLWVRETWAEIPDDGGTWIYRADDPEDAWKTESGVVWRPSIFMPRGVSRIRLTITEVRVERLQEISEEHARAEGVEPVRHPHGGGTLYPYWHGFRAAWDKMHGKKAPWERNPYVWALSFVCDANGEVIS